MVGSSEDQKIGIMNQRTAQTQFLLRPPDKFPGRTIEKLYKSCTFGQFINPFAAAQQHHVQTNVPTNCKFSSTDKGFIQVFALSPAAYRQYMGRPELRCYLSGNITTQAPFLSGLAAQFLAPDSKANKLDLPTHLDRIKPIMQPAGKDSDT